MTRGIAKRNGQPAWKNPPPRQRGDMQDWYPGKYKRPGLLERVVSRLVRTEEGRHP